MPDDTAPTWRTDLMRRMAAVHAEIDLLDRHGHRHSEIAQKRDELQREIAELWEQFLG